MATSLAQVELQLDGELTPEATQRIKKLADVRADQNEKHSPCRDFSGLAWPATLAELAAANYQPIPNVRFCMLLHAHVRCSLTYTDYCR